jgi:hypothetical protein
LLFPPKVKKPERLDAEPLPEREEARHGMDARRRAHEWKPYAVQDPQTMVSDVISECYFLRDEKLVELMPGNAARVPTKR